MRLRLTSLAFVALLGACASLEPTLPPAPTTAEIVRMAKDGVAPDAIIKRIEASRAVYPLPASELARLREQGVPDQVIDYMQRTYIDAVRLNEYLRARDAYVLYGWPSYGRLFPYPYGWPLPYWGWWP
jgi:hypothetical protein